MKNLKNLALKINAPEKVEIIDFIPKPPSDDEVGIKILASSLCNASEMRAFYGSSIEGTYGSKYPMDLGEPGHEAVGEIIETGKSVSEFKQGDIVAMTGHGGPPCHRSYVTRKAGAVAKIDPKRGNLKAVSILEIFGCAYHCVKSIWESRLGADNANVAIIGLGTIGLCSLQIIRLWPVKSITAIDPIESKLKLAKEFGANLCLSPEKAFEFCEFRNRIVIECSGTEKGYDLSQQLAPQVLVNVSYCSRPFSVKQNLWFINNTTIYNPGVLSSNELRAVANLYNRGLLNCERMISRIIKPEADSYCQAIADIKAGKTIKTVIDWET